MAVAKSGGIANASVEIDGLMETLKAVNGLERSFERPAANKELRRAAGTCATVLAVQLAAAASASGVPVAPRVASSLRVKSDRLPVVSIGGAKKVGTGKRGSAGALLWGSEHGPAGDVNHFGVGPNAAGYWIAPTVERFGSDQAVELYRRAVFEVLHGSGLL